MSGEEPILNAGKISQIIGLYPKRHDCVSNAGTVTKSQVQYPNFSGSTSNQASTAPFQILCSLLFVGHLIILYYTYLLIYLLTPWCRVLVEKLTGLQLVKKFPAFHRTRRFITALTGVRHLSLSWACPIQSIYPHPTSWRAILILSTHLYLGLPSGLFPPVSLPRPYTPPSPHPYVPHAHPFSFFSILSPAQYWVRSTNHPILHSLLN